MKEGWNMKHTRIRNQSSIHTSKGGQRLTFIKEKPNLYYLKEKITQEIIIVHYCIESEKSSTAIVSDDEESDTDNEKIQQK